MKKFMKIILALLGLPKSIYFNFRSLPINQAIKLPILLSPITKIVSASGNVKLECPVHFGIIQFGLSGTAGILPHYCCCIQNNGTLIFKGKVFIGGGVEISTSINSNVIFNDNVVFTGLCKILSHDYIEFGNNCLISWDTQICDTDFHNIYIKGSLENADKSVVIGNNVWISSGAVVLKGVHIQDGCIVGCRSLVTKSITEKNCLVVGSPAKIIKHNIYWKQ